MNRHWCSWDSYEVYRHLKFLRYIVDHHNVPWSMKKVKIKIDDQASAEEIDDQASAEEIDSVRDSGSKDNSFITEMFGNSYLGETRPTSDVCPGNPSFVLWLARKLKPATSFR
ncbi:hypothetical protein CDL12_27775 [Handroanthus impetiginosus]|uniref:Uncharacterized protein n=1 Tax=Handroanthus impetiginosus TaxID=429701 RepID=A0A2G9G4A3_9LAMI|nr:hypothetical protein CDL12_27775 [Handroanthus impetiginosus]